MAGRRQLSPKRYAQAIFELAQAGGDPAAWDEELALLAAAAATPEFVALMQAPEIGEEERAKALTHVLPGLSEGGRNLLYMTARARATQALSAIHQLYRELTDAAQGVVRVQVTSAVDLAPEDTERIAQQLSAALGGDVRVEAAVDPELLGGLVIRVGDRVIDGSARQRLNALRGELARGRAAVGA